ncbi:hypothetical protein G6F64_014284 [Rhizopus arrhizus]|uniref:Histidine kinase domain-containing protein n=1 Tax=Rhizopus oryzae TaxID=64495 RepID=A0A9P7BJ42_RHIOR|nr:hypothetical protein G6F64_014284 [Rhizopus arrhizus]
MALDKGLALELDIDPAVPASLHTDAQRLGQVLKNLLSNALKFTQRGTVALRVSRVARDRVAPTAARTASSAARAWGCRSHAIWPRCWAAACP